MTCWVSAPRRGPIADGTTCSCLRATASTSSVSSTSRTLTSSAMMSTNGSSERASGEATVRCASGWRTRRPWVLRTDSVAEHTSRTSSIVRTSPSSPGRSSTRGQSARWTLFPIRVIAVAVEPGVHLVGHVRKERCRHPHEHIHHGVQRVDGVDLAVPEPLPAPADVPVRQRLDEGADRVARAEQVVGVHRPRDVLDEVTGLGDDVAVEHIPREWLLDTVAHAGPAPRPRWRTRSGSTTRSTAAGARRGRCPASRRL